MRSQSARVVGTIAVALLTVSGAASAGHYQQVTCPGGEPVFVPKNCAKELKRTTKDLQLDVSAGVGKLAMTASAGTETELLTERLDQLNIELQTHYIGACMAFARTPCDEDLRVAHNTVAVRLPEIYKELRGQSTPDELRRALESALDQVRDGLDAPRQLDPTGTWSVVTTPVDGACSSDLAHAVRNTWTVTAQEDGQVTVLIDNLAGEVETAYPRLVGRLEGSKLDLAGRPTWGDAETHLSLKVTAERLTGARTVVGPDCTIEYGISGTR